MEKEIKKEEVKKEENNDKTNKNSVDAAESKVDDMFDSDDFGEDNEEESSGVVSESVSEDTVLFRGIVPLKKKKQPYIKNGVKKEATVLWVNFTDTINGKTIVYELFMSAPDNNRLLYDIIDGIYGNSKSYNMDIVKKTITRTENSKTIKTVTYSAQVAGKNEHGAEVVCPLVPRLKSKSDRVIFDVLISMLKSKNYIS